MIGVALTLVVLLWLAVYARALDGPALAPRAALPYVGPDGVHPCPRCGRVEEHGHGVRPMPARSFLRSAHAPSSPR